MSDKKPDLVRIADAVGLEDGWKVTNIRSYVFSCTVIDYERCRKAKTNKRYCPNCQYRRKR